MTVRFARPGAVRLALAAAVTVAALAGPARADGPTAEQRAAAQVLFDDARRLMVDKRWSEACPKLEESQRIDPGLGTLLNLAECQAQSGKTASAWANFLEAAYQAKATNQAKREATARAKAAAIEPRLSRLTVHAPAGIEVRRDGIVMAPSTLGSALPIDPGEHVLRATAPGKKPWEKRIVLKDNADRVTIGVPTLDPEDPGAPPPPPAAPSTAGTTLPVAVESSSPPPAPPGDSGASARRYSGIALLLGGAGGLGVGTALAVLAKHNYDASLSGCPTSPRICTPAGADQRGTARAQGDAATVAFIAGSALAAGGLALVLTALPSSKPAGGRVTVTAGVDPRGGATLGVKGSF